MKNFMGCLLLLPYLLFAQSQEDFQNKFMSVFINEDDSVKAREFAMEAYAMVENNEDLQTMGNYYMLKTVFETIGDSVLIEDSQKKANALMTFDMEITKPSSYENPATEWAYEYQMEFYQSNDPNLGKRALKFIRQHPELINFTSYSAIAYFYERIMDYEKAGEFYALAFENIDYQNNEFVSLIQPAFYYMRVGQYEKVEDCLRLNNELLGSADQYTTVAYENANEMIQMYYHLYIGDYYNYIQSSSSYYERQSELNKDNMIGNPYASISELNQALGFELLRKYEEAEQSYRASEQANAQWLTAMKETYPNYDQKNFPLLDLYLAKRGDLTNRTSRIAELDQYYNYIEKYSTLTLGQKLQKAIQYALYRDQRYLPLLDELTDEVSNLRDFNEATQPISQYAYFLMRDQENALAQKKYKELFDRNLEWINDLIFTFGEKAFVAYFTTKLKEGYQNYHSFVKLTQDIDQSLHEKLAGQAYNNLLLTKSIAFKGIRKRKSAFEKANDPGTVRLYNDWLTKKQRLIRLYQMSQQDNQDLATSLNIQQDSSKIRIIPVGELESLQKEIDRLENRLATSAVGFKETLKVTQPKWQSVRASLKPDEAAVEMIRFYWRNQVYYSDTAFYAAYIIKPDSDHPEVVYLPSFADELDGRYYNLYRNSINQKLEDNTSYDQYWNPIKSRLEGIKKVYFSPDGIYHMINLSTLRNPETGRFVLDEMEVLNVTSTENLKIDKKKATLKSAVLVGRPQYAVQSSDITVEELQTRSFSKDFRNANIVDLPGTEDEVRSISSKLKEQGIEVRQLLGAAATEDEMYGLQSPDVLHIATHGFWSGTENATPGYRMLNAMINSGLLMTGVVDYYGADVLKDSNDGILTAYEAQNLSLEGTKLVVLSACETGLGDFDAGEGVYGLQRAFRTAGSENTVTTLWKVDDQGTKDFMITFYQQMMTLDDRRAAFRTAQLAMKEKYKDPYYWGAFVITGN